MRWGFLHFWKSDRVSPIGFIIKLSSYCLLGALHCCLATKSGTLRIECIRNIVCVCVVNNYSPVHAWLLITSTNGSFSFREDAYRERFAPDKRMEDLAERRKKLAHLLHQENCYYKVMTNLGMIYYPLFSLQLLRCTLSRYRYVQKREGTSYPNEQPDNFLWAAWS